MQLSDGNGQYSGPQHGEQTLGQFALVSYIPDPLGRFLDDLRLELTPGCNPRAHVTVLPPRPLHSDVNEAIARLVEEARSIPPFRVELGDIQVFTQSHVIYLDIRKGVAQLREFYRLVSRGPLKYDRETFPYHPHITIAQNIVPSEVDVLSAMARRKWAEYPGARDFVVSSLSFVQHVAPTIWTDVATISTAEEVPTAG
jgi:2'-5' RNA ligase